LQRAKFLSVEQAAQKLGKSVDRVRRLLRGGKLAGEKIGSKHGGEWRIPAFSLPTPPAEIPTASCSTFVILRYF
jgi:excisionase family DNA binding protein